jgi:hypothetical protein
MYLCYNTFSITNIYFWFSKILGLGVRICALMLRIYIE